MNKIKSHFLLKMDSEFQEMNRQPNYENLKVDFHCEAIDFDSNFTEINKDLMLIAENIHSIASKTSDVEKTLSSAAEKVHLIQKMILMMIFKTSTLYCSKPKIV